MTAASPGPLGRAADRLKARILERLTEKYGISDDARRNLFSFRRLAGPTSGGFPTELLPLGASMWAGFILTPFSQQQMEGWVLPFWLRCQSMPDSPSFVPHGHTFIQGNMTHRNWTGVGLCGFPNEGTVDPRGLITPWPYSPSIDLWVRSGGRLVCPSELAHVDQRLVEGLPIVETGYDALGLRCSWTTLVSPLEGMPVVLSMAELANPGDRNVEAELIVSVRPYNNESVSAINKIRYYPGDGLFKTNDDILVYLPEVPDSVLLSDYQHGDVSLSMRDSRRESMPPGTLEVSEPFGLATGAAVYRVDIAPGKSKSLCFACPLSPRIHPSFRRMLPAGESVSTARRTVDEQEKAWRDVAGDGMTVDIPEDRYQKAFDVNKAFLLLMYDGQRITPGVSTYHMMWFRDAAYLIPALERIGHLEKARGILDTYSDRQTPEGFFRSHNGEWDSNGQAIWTLVNHYRMTGDLGFLKTVYPSIMKGSRWLESMRQTELPLQDPRHGLLPPGISAEHFGISDCYYWDDLWGVAGLRAARDAAKSLGMKGDAAYLERLSADLWEDMRASWHKVCRRLGREVMPASPFRDIDAASIGTLAAVYPLGLMEPGEPILDNTVEEIVARCFHRDTHYHGVMHCGINPYMSMHVAQYYLRRRDPYALTIFESLWSMATDTYTFPEAINPLTGGGAYGDGHDGWSAGDILSFMRNLLVMEEGNKLVLLACCKKEWFDEGNRIAVSGAKTYFGELSYAIDSTADRVVYSLPVDAERPPKSMELNVPFDITSCEVDGRAVGVRDGDRRVDVSFGAGRVAIGISR